jgi:hypothetical protein
MLTVYKPLEESYGINQIKLSTDDEFTLYQDYHNTPEKHRHKFVSANLDKLSYMSKYMDINWFLPLYLSHNFLSHYLTQPIIANLIHGNYKNLIDISNFFSSTFNFNLEAFNSNYQANWKIPNSGHISSERVFAIGFNNVRKKIKPTTVLKKSNKEFFWQDGKIYCTLLNYQRLGQVEKFTDLTNFDLEFSDLKHLCYMCRKPHSKACYFADKTEMCYSCGVLNLSLIHI